MLPVLKIKKLRELILLSLKHSFTLPQGFTDKMGRNDMKWVRVGVFIGEEIKVDKNQLIWLLRTFAKRIANVLVKLGLGDRPAYDRDRSWYGLTHMLKA
jgi:hypothetical protein